MRHKRALKIAGNIILSVICVAIIAFVGLIVYAKFFHSSEVEAESYYTESLPLTKDSFEDDFNEISKIVKDNYSLIESKHLNMDSICNEYALQVKDAQSTEEYGEILQRFFAALQVGHSYIYFKSYKSGLFPVVINDSIFIDKPDQRLVNLGLRDKDRVIAVNGVPMKAWIDRNEKYVSASTALNRRIFAAASAFSSLSDTIRNYTLCRGNDTINVDLPLVPGELLPSKDFNETEIRILNDSIGYLAINTMINGVLESFSSSFDKVKSLPYLIVDVRKNEGGNSGNGRELCRYFLNREQPHCIDNKTMFPQENAYKGKIVLLTSPLTFSAAESFVIDMKESGNIILVGEPTAGDTGNHPKTFKTSKGICFRIPTAEPALSPKGFPLEGIGIDPHYHVQQTVADYLNETDTQLKFALMLISQNKI